MLKPKHYNKLKANLMQFILKFKKFKIEDGIIICGEPRSGTTWVLDLLEKIPNTFTHWEPFRQEDGVVPKEWKWGDRIFIPKEDKNEKYYQIISNSLSLKIFTPATIRINQQSVLSVIQSKFLITKFVRINLLLPYIVSNFKFKNKPILILRHPIDTCLSQMNAFSYNRIFPRKIPDWLNNERYLKETEYLQSLSSALEYNIALWCINNCPLLEDKATLQRLNIVLYSDLVLNPKQETRRIFSELHCINSQEIESLIRSINFRQASMTDFKKNFIPNPKKQLEKNINNLSENEKQSIQKVFDHFGLKLYDAYSVFPKKECL